MSESSQASDPYALLGIVRNPDGTITFDRTKFPRVPPTPDAVVSKDFRVNYSKSTYMRLYVPTTALNGGVSSMKLPLVVYFHGGGFINDSYDHEPVHHFCNLMALKLNVVVASASYRQAPQFKLPAAYDDGLYALKWIKNSPDKGWIKSYADLSDVFLMGTNSGGNVAYNVGIRFTEEDLTPLCIRGLILLDPFFGGEERCESELRHVNDQVFPPALTDLCWKLCLPDGADRDHEYSNPRMGEGPEIMQEMAGFRWKVMVTGEGGGAMIDRQRDVANLMKENGVYVIEHFTDGDGHGGDPNKTETMFASIKSLIYSSPPVGFVF
ncbi:unnamed protein product [Eruca vesicaria subsp. sativa]|uniref:Alpha/beta hydrolase fold-3 domain-containing protein n=1 Tax=Eruca vesicaria subsp. sativa TaxID=29727 RepID=A0ABC8KZW7_ERUVS|nr:unnamed protein product [Eruca vesicaria subsp. sativa]